MFKQNDKFIRPSIAPMSLVPSLAVLGTMSDAGKSIIVAGVCRIFSNHGIRVAPFKGQNMSNNATPALLPTAEHLQTMHSSNKGEETAKAYGEIGTAQALQARACRIFPRVEMNPVLLKSGGRRQSDGAYLASVILLGKQIACEDFGMLGQRTNNLLECVLQAHDQLVLSTSAQVVVIEGAGSCTELNLMERDIVNLPLVRRLQCPWILVANIDCGGVFAQIVGTKTCLPDKDWDACVGIVVNKLRGEAKYFEPGPAILQEMVGKPIFVVPFLDNLNLAEEDGLGVERRLAGEWRHARVDQELVGEKRKARNNSSLDQTEKSKECYSEPTTKPLVVVIAYPHVSMADELASVESDRRFNVQWRRDAIPPLYPSTTTVILPGSRLTRCDLQWLHDSGWAEWILQHVAAGGNVFGICGGYQMLGKSVDDETGVEGSIGTTMGLKLLPVRTVIHPAECKRVTPRIATLLHQDISIEEAIRVEGFELHCGETILYQSEHCSEATVLASARPLLRFVDDGEMEGWSVDRVTGTYLHGILGSAEARRQLLAPDWDFGKEPWPVATTEDDDLDRLARHLEDCGLTFDTLSKMVHLDVTASVASTGIIL
jgi:adenosylcobyric acid synthase